MLPVVTGAINQVAQCKQSINGAMLLAEAALSDGTYTQLLHCRVQAALIIAFKYSGQASSCGRMPAVPDANCARSCLATASTAFLAGQPGCRLACCGSSRYLSSAAATTGSSRAG
eukprot:GHRQ01033667.1.p2 GENE.GHRQ01033667.1~~GHRQ01033667.1.p2  ORF type:complete len:115 (-),score=14.08 GHRQ01033667.1:426-770(-)